VNTEYYAIVNGAAGAGRCAKLAPNLIAALERRGITLTVAPTAGPRHATELAQRAAQDGCRRFLSVGGDGTAAEIVNGLVDAGVSEDCELAMLPLGTGNSFLRDFGITDLETASDAIARGDSAPIDVLRLTHEHGVIHFINTMGTGFVARVGQLSQREHRQVACACDLCLALFEALRQQAGAIA